MLYATHSILTSNYQIASFPKNQPPSLGRFLQKYSNFFELVIFPCFRPNPYYQNVCIDHRIIFICS